MFIWSLRPLPKGTTIKRLMVSVGWYLGYPKGQLGATGRLYRFSTGLNGALKEL